MHTHAQTHAQMLAHRLHQGSLYDVSDVGWSDRHDVLHGGRCVGRGQASGGDKSGRGERGRTDTGYRTCTATTVHTWAHPHSRMQKES